MDIQNIDLRRGDFEAMHPTARLLNFDAEKMVYFGDKPESINSQWATWCACIGMLHLDGKEAQAVPEVISIGSELQSWVAVNSFAASDAVGDFPIVDANELAEVIEKLTGASQ